MTVLNIEKIISFKSNHAEPMAHLISQMIDGQWENNPQRFGEILKRRDPEKWTDGFLEHPWVQENLPLAISGCALKLLGAVIDRPSALSSVGWARIRDDMVTLFPAAWEGAGADYYHRDSAPREIGALFDDAVAVLMEEVLDQAAAIVRDPKMLNPQFIALRSLVEGPVPTEEIFHSHGSLGSFDDKEEAVGIHVGASTAHGESTENLAEFFERFLSTCETVLESWKKEEAPSVSREEILKLKKDLLALKHLPEMEASEAHEILDRIQGKHQSTVEKLVNLQEEEHEAAPGEDVTTFHHMLQSFLTAYYLIGCQTQYMAPEIWKSDVDAGIDSKDPYGWCDGDDDSAVTFSMDRQMFDAVLENMRFQLNGMILIREERDALLQKPEVTRGLSSASLVAMNDRIQFYLLRDAQQAVAEFRENISAAIPGSLPVGAAIPAAQQNTYTLHGNMWEMYVRDRGNTETSNPLGLDDVAHEEKIYEALLSGFLEAVFAQAKHEVESRAERASSGNKWGELHNFLDTPMECIPMPERQETLAVTRRSFLQWAEKQCHMRTGCLDEADLQRPQEGAFSRWAEIIERLPYGDASEAEAEIKSAYRQGEVLIQELKDMQSFYTKRKSHNSIVNHMSLMLGHICGKLEEMVEDLASHIEAVRATPPVPGNVLSVADCFRSEKIAARPAAANDLGA